MQLNIEDGRFQAKKAGKMAIMKIRTAVSGDKKRLQHQDFDLDFTYITPRIIGMAFPAETFFEQAYRNHIDEVRDFLERTHGDHYMVFNLTCEKHYDPFRFNNKVQSLGWWDHHAPALQHLFRLMRAIHSWMSADPQNVSVLHCKAVKGRTGTAIASYFIYSGQYATAREALACFARARSAKGKGVTVPSQIRYVEYLEKIVRGEMPKRVYKFPTPLVIKEIVMHPVVDVGYSGRDSGMNPAIQIANTDDLHNPIFSLKLFRAFKRELGDTHVSIPVGDLVVSGDIYVRIYHISEVLGKQTKKRLLFRFAFHTSFIRNHTFEVTAAELDGPGHGQLKNSNFTPDFRVRVLFGDAPSSYVPQRASRKKQQAVEVVQYPAVPPAHAMSYSTPASPSVTIATTDEHFDPFGEHQRLRPHQQPQLSKSDPGIDSLLSAAAASHHRTHPQEGHAVASFRVGGTSDRPGSAPSTTVPASSKSSSPPASSVSSTSSLQAPLSPRNRASNGMSPPRSPVLSPSAQQQKSRRKAPTAQQLPPNIFEPSKQQQPQQQQQLPPQLQQQQQYPQQAQQYPSFHISENFSHPTRSQHPPQQPYPPLGQQQQQHTSPPGASVPSSHVLLPQSQPHHQQQQLSQQPALPPRPHSPSMGSLAYAAPCHHPMQPPFGPSMGGPPSNIIYYSPTTSTSCAPATTAPPTTAPASLSQQFQYMHISPGAMPPPFFPSYPHGGQPPPQAGTSPGSPSFPPLPMNTTALPGPAFSHPHRPTLHTPLHPNSNDKSRN